MDAQKIWILQDFMASNRILFRIPVYQRNYDWSEPNCNRLLDDIKTIIDTGKKHFIGTIVYMLANEGGVTLREYTIIDGQQRLTTITLMLKALVDVANEINDPAANELMSFIQNNYCEEQYKVKLKPIKSDNDQFLALLAGKFDEMDKDGHIYKNYLLAKNRIQRWIKNGIKPLEIMNAMYKLEIVAIVLKEGEDDPQIIFESINSTGMELSNADLIRNFLLMNADDQDGLFEDYWLPIEKSLKKKTDYTNLNLFFSQYLVFKTNAAIDTPKVYQSFVNFFKEAGHTKESCLKELKYYATIFKSFVDNDDRYSKTVRKVLRNLRMLKQTTCYPFLLHLFDDYEQHVISESTLEKTLLFIQSYLIRRMVCGIQSNTLRGLFRNLYNRIFKVSANKEKYYESINKFFYTETGNIDMVVSDPEFHRALREGNLYSNRALCKFLLMDIENGDGKETLNFDNLTIEHLMPQTQSLEWMHISKEDHELYLHVLGNLTITGYNSELSNNAFEEKKRIIAENSKAVILNSDVTNQPVWNVEAIKARGERLANIVAARYAMREVKDEIAFEYMSTITLDMDFDVTKKKLVLFHFDGRTYRQDRYALMLFDVLKLLDKMKPGRLEELADQNFYLSNYRQHSHISRDKKEMRWPWEIRDGIFMEANLSAQGMIRFIDRLFEEFGVDKSLFDFCIVSDGEEPEIPEDEPEDLTDTLFDE